VDSVLTMLLDIPEFNYYFTMFVDECKSDSITISNKTYACKSKHSKNISSKIIGKINEYIKSDKPRVSIHDNNIYIDIQKHIMELEPNNS
jgi:hypothetical protein